MVYNATYFAQKGQRPILSASIQGWQPPTTKNHQELRLSYFHNHKGLNILYNLESLYHYCIIGMPTYSYFLLGINNVLTLYKVVQKNHCFFVIQSECKIGMTPLFTFNNMSSLFAVGLHIFSLGPKINFSNLNSRANSCN